MAREWWRDEDRVHLSPDMTVEVAEMEGCFPLGQAVRVALPPTEWDTDFFDLTTLAREAKLFGVGNPMTKMDVGWQLKLSMLDPEGPRRIFDGSEQILMWVLYPDNYRSYPDNPLPDVLFPDLEASALHSLAGHLFHVRGRKYVERRELLVTCLYENTEGTDFRYRHGLMRDSAAEHARKALLWRRAFEFARRHQKGGMPDHVT